MTIEEKKKRAFIAMVRGMQPVKFVRDYLSANENRKNLDEPRLRSFYILLSFGFELILKSRIIMLSNALDGDELNKELSRTIGHDFVKISNRLGSDEIKKIGIKSIILKNSKCNDPVNQGDMYSNFIIETTDGEIIIENFTDIRYGCMGGGMRTVSHNEHDKVLNYTNLTLEICKKIEDVNKISMPAN